MEASEYLHWCIAPSYTCWAEDESFDEKAQRNLWDFMLQSGAINSYFIRSGMGQAFSYAF